MHNKKRDQKRHAIAELIVDKNFVEAERRWLAEIDYRSASLDDTLMWADIQFGLGRYDRAAALFKLAYHACNDVDPIKYTSGVQLAFSLLLLDPFNQEGWKYFTSRARAWKNSETIAEYDRRAEWSPGADRGRRLVVYGDMGFGDSLMISRYYRLIDELHPNFVIKVHPRLRRALEQLYPRYEFSSNNETRPDDLFIRDMSIPSKLGCSLLREALSSIQYVKNLRVSKVGVCWNTSKSDLQEWLKRSIPFSAFKKLMSDGCQFYSLAPPEMSPVGGEKIPANLDMSMTGDMSAMATMISEMDLVITVDSAAAHLAGTMGKPVWVLLPRDCCWRWGREGDRTPLYPSMRLFRQAVPGDWEGVVGDVAQALREVSAAEG